MKAVLIGTAPILQTIASLFKTQLKSVVISEDGEENVVVTSDGKQQIDELKQLLLDKQVVIDELKEQLAQQDSEDTPKSKKKK